MDRIDEIVRLLNSNILKVGNTQDAFVYGITELIVSDSQNRYFEKKAEGVMTTVSIDDSRRMTIFHLLGSMSNENDYEKGNGSRPLTIETYNLSLYVFYSNPTNSLVSREILEIIKLAIPSTLKRQNKDILMLKNIKFDISEARTDKYTLFDEVFAGSKNNLSDESIFIKLDYKVTLSFDKACVPFDPCDLDTYDIEFQRSKSMSCEEVRQCVSEELENIHIDGGNASNL